MDGERQRYRWNPRVACRTVEETAFILLEGRMISLNPVATRMWQLFEQGATVEQVAGRITEEYEVGLDVASVDAVELAGSLSERGMLVVT